MTNPYIAGAAAERYLTDLFFQAETDDAKFLARHVLENVRRGEDGYPVLKIVGKNRLVFEFDLNVAPIGPKALAQTKQLVEGPGVPMTAEAFAHLRHHVGSEETIKPADPEPVEHPEAGRTAAGPADDLVDAEIVGTELDPSHPDWPKRQCPHISNGQQCRFFEHTDDVQHSYGGGLTDPVDARHCDEPAQHDPHAWTGDKGAQFACSGEALPVSELPRDQGYRSSWAEKGDAARAKRELPTDPTEADLPAPLDQESTTAQDAAGSSR